jgi:hypothetical protein
MGSPARSIFSRNSVVRSGSSVLLNSSMDSGLKGELPQLIIAHDNIATDHGGKAWIKILRKKPLLRLIAPGNRKSKMGCHCPAALKWLPNSKSSHQA